MRYRFEKISQVFDVSKDDIIILPLREINDTNELKPNVWVELPTLIYPEDEDAVKDKLKRLKVSDVVCENIGAIEIANELSLRAHGGAFLNVLNSEAIDVYKSLGLLDVTMSIELSFSELRKMESKLPYGVIIYGYLPLMKFRACPGECNTCQGMSELTDRLGEKFTLICRDRKYSELLNSVPLYVADKSVPECSFETLYFTKESRKEAQEIVKKVYNRESLPVKRTGGLYFRELL